MRSQRILFPLCLALVALAVGCRTAPVMLPDPEISVDPALKNDLAVSGFLVMRNQGNLTQVQVTLQNLRYGTLPLEVKTDWFDLNGVLQESMTSSWKTVSVGRQAQLPLKITGPNEQAVNFRIYIREAKRN
jgi:uncharacterized protein YcfL